MSLLTRSKYAEATNYVAEQNVYLRLDSELLATGLQTRKANSIVRAIRDVLRVELETAYCKGFVDGATTTPNVAITTQVNNNKQEDIQNAKTTEN